MGALDESLIVKALASDIPAPELPTAVLGGIKKENGPALSWMEAARQVNLDPRPSAVEAFERSLLPSVRTLSAQFDCELCPRCRRPVVAAVIDKHIKDCEARSAVGSGSSSSAAIRASSAQAGDGETSDDDHKHSGNEAEGAGAAVKTRKRKADTDGTAAKKKARSAKPKAPRAPKPPKQPKEKVVVPFNPDKQCGVPLPNGALCQRSLTCKAHSMGAKRQVTGRSLPYDVLLGRYQRQNQIKQAQLSATQAATLAESDQQLEAQAQMNPEKEVQQVLEGVRHVYCAPLDRRVMIPSRLRVNNFRLREMLALALLPKGIPPVGDALYGRSLIFSPEDPDRLQYVRAPAVQRAMYLASLQQQRQAQLRQQAQARAQGRQTPPASQGAPGQGQRPPGPPRPNSAQNR